MCISGKILFMIGGYKNAQQKKNKKLFAALLGNHICSQKLQQVSLSHALRLLIPESVSLKFIILVWVTLNYVLKKIMFGKNYKFTLLRPILEKNVSNLKG